MIQQFGIYHSFQTNCQVCFNSFFQKLLTCIQCNLKIHYSCYGGDMQTQSKYDKKPFLCDRCKYARTHNIDITKINCKFCPFIQGAMKQVWFQKQKNKKFWAHLCCVNLQPNLYFLQPSQNPPILSYTQIAKWNQVQSYKKCNICKIDKGMTLKCNYLSGKKPACKNGFHAICGYKKKILKYLIAVKNIFMNKQYQYDFSLYCQHHLRMMLAKNKNYMKTGVFADQLFLSLKYLFEQFGIDKQLNESKKTEKVETNSKIQNISQNDGQNLNKNQSSSIQVIDKKIKKSVQKSEVIKQQSLQQRIKKRQQMINEYRYEQLQGSGSWNNEFTKENNKKKNKKYKLSKGNKNEIIQEDEKQYYENFEICKDELLMNQIYVGRRPKSRIRSFDFIIGHQNLNKMSYCINIKKMQISPLSLFQKLKFI